MSVNFEIKTKKALFLNGKQVTGYEWDHFNIDNIHEIIVATTDENYLALFDLDGILRYEIGSCIDYEIMSRCILLKGLDTNTPLYGIVSFEGEVLLPFMFTSVKRTHDKNILKINMYDIVKGYYIISTNQIILNAEHFKCNSSKEYMFYEENGWNKYLLVNGKYERID